MNNMTSYAYILEPFFFFFSLILLNLVADIIKYNYKPNITELQSRGTLIGYNYFNIFWLITCNILK